MPAQAGIHACGPLGSGIRRNDGREIWHCHVNGMTNIPVCFPIFDPYAYPMVDLENPVDIQWNSAIGFGLALVLFAGIREHLDLAEVPAGIRGVPAALIVAGLLSLAFMGFTGIV